MELCSMLCGSPDGRGVWGRMDTCICMAEFTIHLKLSQRCLLVSYTSLQNKKFKNAKKKKKKKLLTQRAFQVPLVVKNAGDIKSDSIPGLGRSPGGGHGNPPAFFPGESHGQRSLAGLRSMGLKRVGHD